MNKLAIIDDELRINGFLSTSEPEMSEFTGVRPVLIVMCDPASQNTAQAVFHQCDKKVRILFAECADDTFTDAVGLRASTWRREDPKTHMRSF